MVNDNKCKDCKYFDATNKYCEPYTMGCKADEVVSECNIFTKKV